MDKKRILVTDDATFMRMMLVDILSKNGYECIEAKNGNEMVDMYEKEKPDLVTLDITMPECDGLEGLKKLLAKFPDAKVIMCSAMGQQAMVVESIKSGAKDFIVKPFQQERVIDAISKILA